MSEDSMLLASMKEDIEKQKAEASAEDDTEQADETEAKTDAGDEDTDEDSASDDKAETKEKDKQVDDEDSEDDAELTRGQTRHQKLANQLKEERAERAAERKERESLIEERATLKAQIAYEQQQKSAGQSAHDRRAEEERLSLLTPDERRYYDADNRSKSLEQRLNAMEWANHDNSEKSTFQSQAAHDPLVGKYKDEVERMRSEDLKKGYAASRDEYLNFIVGRELRKDAAKKLSAKKDSANKRVDSVTSKSANARGDVSGTKKGKGNSLEELEARLEGVVF